MIPVPIDVLVIGAGQAGLSAAYHLQRNGYAGLGSARAGERGTYVVLDANGAPAGRGSTGGRRCGWAVLTPSMSSPASPFPRRIPAAASRDVLPAYFAEYERRFALAVERPVRVRAVRREDADPGGRLLVESDRGTWAARYVINATGTWTRPFWPHYPGRASFRGRQLHVADYVDAAEFTGRRVVIVGAGVSAVQLLDEISRVADTFWVTRREPRWIDEDFDVPARIAAVAGVEERVRRGLPRRA